MIGSLLILDTRKASVGEVGQLEGNSLAELAGPNLRVAVSSRIEHHATDSWPGPTYLEADPRIERWGTPKLIAHSERRLCISSTP